MEQFSLVRRMVRRHNPGFAWTNSVWAYEQTADRLIELGLNSTWRTIGLLIWNLPIMQTHNSPTLQFVLFCRVICVDATYFLPTLSVYTTQPVAQPAVQLFVSRIRCVTHRSPCCWMVRCGASFVSFTRCRSQQVRYFCCDHRRLTLSWTYNRVWGPRRTKCVSFIR